MPKVLAGTSARQLGAVWVDSVACLHDLGWMGLRHTDAHSHARSGSRGGRSFIRCCCSTSDAGVSGARLGPMHITGLDIERSTGSSRSDARAPSSCLHRSSRIREQQRHCWSLSLWHQERSSVVWVLDESDRSSGALSPYDALRSGRSDAALRGRSGVPRAPQPATYRRGR